MYCKNIWQNQTWLSIYKFANPELSNSQIGFNIAFTNVEDTLKQRQEKVVSTLFHRGTPMLYQRFATLKNRRRILFHSQRRISVISTLIRR